MNKHISVRKGVTDTPAYKAGLPIDLVAREYGIAPESIIKLASNENPLGPSPKAVEAVRRELANLNRYPDGSAWNLTTRLCEKHGLSREQFIIGDGSNEILELLAQVFLEPGTNAVMGEYPFVVYPLVTRHFGAEVRRVPMPDLRHDCDAMLDAIDENTRLVFIASPNNPTPYDIPANEIERLIERLPDHVVLCFDSAYSEYLDNPPDLTPFVRAGKNIVVTHTFSKIYGLAGLRVGYAYAPAWIIALLMRTRQPFSVNSLALVGALAALDDQEFVERSRKTNKEGIAQLCEGLTAMGLQVDAAQANFILVAFSDAEEMSQKLLKQGVIVRPMKSFSLDGMIRVSVGLPTENERFLNAVAGLLASRHVS